MSRKERTVNTGGMTFKSWIQTVMAVLVPVVMMLGYFEGKFDEIDARLDKVESRLDKIEARLDKIESRLDILEARMDALQEKFERLDNTFNAYMTWRFVYVHDPSRKNLVPRYNPATRTLEFVHK